MGIFTNAPPMPFSAKKQVVLEVPTSGATESYEIDDSSATAQALNIDTAFVQNEGSVTAYFTFTAGAETVVPGSDSTSNNTLGQPILSGMGMSIFVTPLATHANASVDANGGNVSLLRISFGKGQ